MEEGDGDDLAVEEVKWRAIEGAGFEFGTAGFVVLLREDVLEDALDGFEGLRAAVDGDGAGLAEIEGADVVEAEDVVGVAVSEEDGVEFGDADAEGLVTEIGRGVDDDVFVIETDPDGGAEALIARVVRGADVSIAADGWDADTGAGAEDGEGGEAQFGSSGMGIPPF